jgi:hypothetical protein
MDRSRRSKSAARPRLEGLENRSLLTVGVELPGGTPPAGEVTTLAATSVPETETANPPAPEDLMYMTSGGPRAPRSPMALAAARRRAERMADRWERQDAAGPRIVDTTLLTRGDQVVGFALTFDSPMRADAAIDPNAYRAIRITTPNAWLARLTYQGDGPDVEELTIRDVEYRAEDRMAVIWLRDPRRATGKFRIGVVTHESPGQRRARPLALGPLTDLNGRVVRRNPADVRLPGRNVLFTQPDHSVAFDAPRIRGE